MLARNIEDNITATISGGRASLAVGFSSDRVINTDEDVVSKQQAKRPV